MELIRKSNLPLYVQIRNQLKQKIMNGEFKPLDFIPTEQELCEDFGVSLITVRQALKDLVNEGLLCRVPRRGTYVTEFNSKEIKQKRIGIIMRSAKPSESFFLTETLRGVENANDGCQVILAGTATDSAQFIKILEKADVDGLLLVALDPILGRRGSAVLKDMIKMPFALLYTHIYEPDIYTVFTDLRRSTAEVTDHLVGLGHTRIAFINGMEASQGDMERLEGYRLSLEKHGIRFDESLVLWDQYDTNNTSVAVDQLLKLTGPPTAIIASEDETAVEAIKTLKVHGLSVPKDMAVVGHNDSYVAKMMNPQITTVSEPLFETGRRATWLLRNLMDGLEAEEHQIILPTKLVVRESCGAGLGAVTV